MKSIKYLFFISILSLGLFLVTCGDGGGGGGGGSTTCIDEDGDGRGLNCNKGVDCDDSDPNSWKSCSTCKDQDEDWWYVGCDAFETISGPDCDDSNFVIYSNAFEFCDCIDNQCEGDEGYGISDEGCSWAKTYGGDSVDDVNSVIQTFDGNYVAAGVTDNMYSSSGDIRIIKYGSCGDEIWNKVYDDGNWNEARSIWQTEDGGYIVAARYGLNGIWIMKLDESGDISWDKKSYNGRDIASIQQTQDGGYVGAGKIGDGFYILKTDEYGNISWEKSYSGPLFDWAKSIQQTSDGGYIVAGMKGFNAAVADDPNVWVLKLDENGDLVWDKEYDKNDTDRANSVKQTSDGGYIVAGETCTTYPDGCDIWILKLNQDGDSVWKKTYGGSDYDVAESVQQTQDGGYIVAGSRRVSPPAYDEVWILKLDENGNVTWDRIYGGNLHDAAKSIQQTTDGGYIVGGRTWSYGSGAIYDMWTLKLDENGNCIGPGCP